MGRPRKESALERVGQIAAEALPPPPLPEVDRGDFKGGALSRVVTSGKAEQVVWLKICAWPNVKIATATGLGADSIDRYVRSPHYLALFEARKQEFLGKVFEEMQGRLLEVGLEALQARLDTMRDAKAPRWLRDKIAASLVEMAMAVGQARGPRGEVVDKLFAAVERIRKRKLADGSTEIEKVRVTGRAGEAAEALAEAVGAAVGAPVDEQGGSGVGAGPDPGPGEAR